MTTTRKGAGKALRLNLPGAPLTWHYLPGTPGLFHPEIATPLDLIGLDEEGAKILSDDKSLHVELVDQTEDEAKTAHKALAEATGQALDGVRDALGARETAEERDRILAAAKSAKAVKTTNDQEA